MSGVGRHQLKINAFEMLRRPGTVKPIQFSISPSSLELLDPRLAPETEIDIDIVCESLSDGIVVNGRMTATFHGECRRCLSPMLGRIEADVHELYQLTLTDPDAFEIEGDIVDLAPMVRETVLLELPDSPLCRRDCPGLCPTCGRVLDQGSCSCPAEVLDSRWSVLDVLRDQLPE